MAMTRVQADVVVSEIEAWQEDREKPTIETGLCSGIGTHGRSAFQTGTTADIGNSSKFSLTPVGSQSLDETERTKVHSLHLVTNFLLGCGLYRAEDGESSVIDEYIDVGATGFEIVDDLGAVRVGHIERDPLAALGFNF